MRIHRTSHRPFVSAALIVLVPLALGLTAQQPAPAPPADPIVKENVTVHLADHTYVIPDGNVGGVPNVGIIVGSRATLVIDPGMGKRNGEAVLREVGKVSKNSELYIATTHYHPEHTTGYLAFPPSAKYVNSKIQEAEFAESGMQMVKTFAGRTPAMGELLKDAQGRKADITFDREHTLDLGGVQVRFVVVGPTHTRGDTGFFVVGDRVLFSGDVVMNRAFLAANQNSSLKAWFAAFDTFAALKPRTIVPSHGGVGDNGLIGANRAYFEDVRTRVRELKTQKKSVEEIAETLTKTLPENYFMWTASNRIGAAVRLAYAETP